MFGSITTHSVRSITIPTYLCRSTYGVGGGVTVGVGDPVDDTVVDPAVVVVLPPVGGFGGATTTLVSLTNTQSR